MNKRKAIYTDAPKNISRVLTEGKVVADFLPPPEKLIRKEPKVKITITLNTGSVDFFKDHARKHNVRYQFNAGCQVLICRPALRQICLQGTDAGRRFRLPLRQPLFNES